MLLRGEGMLISVSMVGRILSDLKRRGTLVEPKRFGISAKKRRCSRPYAVRKPKDWVISSPGDLVEVDTLDVRPLPGMVFKHFTARDVVSRYDVLELHGRATSRTAATFLEAVCSRMPFSIRAFQVDGGSEFKGEFEAACERLGIPLFVLPPRSPKLNGHVERAQGTHTVEFYELYEGPLTVASISRSLREHERVYNTIRPHQSLNYQTPSEYLAGRKDARVRCGRFPSAET